MNKTPWLLPILVLLLFVLLGNSIYLIRTHKKDKLEFMANLPTKTSLPTQPMTYPASQAEKTKTSSDAPFQENGLETEATKLTSSQSGPILPFQENGQETKATAKADDSRDAPRDRLTAATQKLTGELSQESLSADETIIKLNRPILDARSVLEVETVEVPKDLNGFACHIIGYLGGQQFLVHLTSRDGQEEKWQYGSYDWQRKVFENILDASGAASWICSLGGQPKCAKFHKLTVLEPSMILLTLVLDESGNTKYFIYDPQTKQWATEPIMTANIGDVDARKPGYEGGTLKCYLSSPFLTDDAFYITASEKQANGKLKYGRKKFDLASKRGGWDNKETVIFRYSETGRSTCVIHKELANKSQALGISPAHYSILTKYACNELPKLGTDYYAKVYIKNRHKTTTQVIALSDETSLFTIQRQKYFPSQLKVAKTLLGWDVIYPWAVDTDIIYAGRKMIFDQSNQAFLQFTMFPKEGNQIVWMSPLKNEDAGIIASKDLIVAFRRK